MAQLDIYEAKNTSAGGPAPDLESLIFQTQFFMENEVFESALQYCNKILEQDPKNGDAYWYRLMAEVKSADEAGLPEKLLPLALDGTLESHPDFARARCFAGGGLAARIDEVVREVGRLKEEKEREAAKRLRFVTTLLKVLKITGVIAACVLLVGTPVYFWATADLSAGRVSDEIKACGMPDLMNDKKFIYSGALIEKVDLAKAKDREKTYRGEAVLELAGRIFRRPVEVSYTKKDGRIIFSYTMDHDYSRHPEFLEEDAPIFFEQLKKYDDWLTWDFISAKSPSPGVLRITAGQTVDGNRAETEVRIENENGRLVCRIIDGRGSPRWYCDRGRDFLSGLNGVAVNRTEAARCFRRAAELGYVAAQYELGNCYYKGDGVAVDFAEAVKWFRKAAEREIAPARAVLGECYAKGRGVARDPVEAVKWFRKAAEQNFAPAQFDLGVCCHRGRGVARDPVEAVKWFRKAAEQEHAGAQYELGKCYAIGDGVDKDLAEAVKWYRKAAEQGEAKAQFKLGACCYNGDGIDRDHAEAAKWFRKAAELGHAGAQYNLGICVYNGDGLAKDETEAVKWFRKAAEQGHAGAQTHLGYCYNNGRGVATDPAEAVKWYRKAAEQGFAGAQFNMGYCYNNGRGVAIDPAEAVKWYRKAAEQGFAAAQFNMGLSYENGRGVYKEPAEAVKWYRKAAEQGHAGAKARLRGAEQMFAAERGDAETQYRLGKSCEDDRDFAGAVKWYRKAAEQGHAGAKTRLSIAESFSEAEQGDVRAQNKLGMLYAEGRGVDEDHAEAVKWFRKAAEQGFAAAQFNMGFCYENGRGVYKDLTEAVKWYRKAAAQGHSKAREYLSFLENVFAAEKGDTEAQYKVGNYYFSRNNFSEAAEWYRKAAEQGHSKARTRLGDCYYNKGEYFYNRGYYSEAVDWYRRAAELEHSGAEFKLGLCYETGRGVARDYYLAVKWYAKSRSKTAGGK